MMRSIVLLSALAVTGCHHHEREGCQDRSSHSDHRDSRPHGDREDREDCEDRDGRRDGSREEGDASADGGEAVVPGSDATVAAIDAGVSAGWEAAEGGSWGLAGSTFQWLQ